MEYKYFQFASPFNSERIVTTADKVDNYWDESIGLDTGRSWQFFDDQLIHYCKYNGSSSGYHGMSTSPIVPIDIDNMCTDNLQRVLDKILKITGYAMYQYLVVFYSGKKGFHIELPSFAFNIEPCENLPQRMKRLVTGFDIGADLSLYKSNMLYRIPNSLNVSGDCYKVPVKIDEVYDGLTIEQIQSNAKKPIANSFCMEYYLTVDDLYKGEESTTKMIDLLFPLWDETKCPDNTRLQIAGGVSEGNRNTNAYDTALSLKTQQYSKEVAYDIIMAQNEENNPPEENYKTLLKTVDSAYNGHFFKKFPINPVFQHLREDVYWKELSDKRKVIYIMMLMEANVREALFEGHRIKRNQFVYGKISTAKKWNINQDALRTILDKFEKDGIIRKEVIKHKGRNLFTIITILSFDVYTHNDTHGFNKENV